MAVNSLGRLTLDMVVKLGNYMEGLDKAGRQAKKSGKEIESGLNVGSLAIKALGAAVAGISVGGIVAFAHHTIDAGNEIKKFSQLANTSIHDFQYYSKGALTAGLGIEDFSQKMKDMQDRIGDFQQNGSGPMADFFTNIAPLVGVTIQQFQKLSGPEALQLFYDSLVKVGLTRNDIVAYMEQIISDSTLLVPLLENNGAGFKKWGEEAQRTGAILSDDVVNSLTKAKESLYVMDMQWQGMQANLINNAIPIFELVAENIDNIQAVGGAVAAMMVARLIPGVIASTIQLGQLGVFAVRAGVGLVGLSSSAGVATGAMVALRAAVAFLGGPAGLAMLAFQGIAAGSAFLYLKNSSKDIDVAFETQGKTVVELTKAYEELDTTQRRLLERQATAELSKAEQEFRKQEIALLGLVRVINNHSDAALADKKAAKELYDQYLQGKMNADQLATGINNLRSVEEKHKTAIDDKAKAVGLERTAVERAKEVLGAYSSQVKESTKHNIENAQSINTQAQAYLSLTQKQRAVVIDLQQQSLREQYINNNIQNGWSRDQAEYFADKREAAGESYNKVLSKEMFIQIEAGYKLQQQIKTREESEKGIAEQKKKQFELAEKQYSYSKQELAMLQKVSALSAKHNLDGIGAKYGLPKNMLAAVMAQESKGDINAKSPTGAIGPFQTTGTYRKQYGLSVADSYDVQKTAEAAAKDIAKSFEVFGNWNDAITAYNAGVGGTKSLKNKGFTQSDAKTKEAKGYAPNVNKWMVGLGGSANKDGGFSRQDAVVGLKDWTEYQQNLEEIRQQALERQKTVQQTYWTDEQYMLQEHKEKIKAIAEAYAGDDIAIKKYTALENQAYEKSVSEYKKSLTQKSLDEKKQLLDVRKNWMTAAEYAQEYYALVREEILNTAEYSPEMKNALVKQANAQQGMDQNAERENVWGDYQDRFDTYNPYQEDMDLLKAARDHMLLTEDEYQQQRLSLQLSYGAQYGADFAGMMMGLVDSSSSAYAVLAGVQKGAALFSTAMNSYTAISAAWASAPFPYNLPAVGIATMETGLLQAAVSALSPVGMAHDGIDNIPKEGTWLLDGGERVLNPQQNKDLTNYLSQAQQSNSSTSTPQNLQINNILDPSIVGDFMGTSSGTKTFMNFIKNNRSSIKAMIG